MLTQPFEVACKPFLAINGQLYIDSGNVLGHLSLPCYYATGRVQSLSLDRRQCRMVLGQLYPSFQVAARFPVTGR